MFYVPPSDVKILFLSSVFQPVNNKTFVTALIDTYFLLKIYGLRGIFESDLEELNKDPACFTASATKLHFTVTVFYSKTHESFT